MALARMSTASTRTVSVSHIFSVVAKDTSVEKEQEFLQVTEEVLEKLAAEGFDEKALLAGIQLLRIQIQRGRFRFLSQGTDVWFTGAGQLAV